MNKFENHIIQFIKVFIIPLIVVNAVIYLIGSFIAMDFDYKNWWAFNSTFGRVLLSLFELMVLVNIPKFWDEYDK